MTEKLIVTRAVFDVWWAAQHISLFEILTPEEEKQRLDNRWGWLCSAVAKQEYKEAHGYD